jgi:chemotaxis protein CheD
MPTPEKLTLAQRMEQARLRTAAARTQAGLPGSGGLGAGSPAAGLSGTGVSGTGRKPSPAGASAGTRHDYWMVSAGPGDHVVLMPGQMHFGAHAASIRTLLGSCVAVTLWHPSRRIGGMCHFLLPSRTRVPGELDGRYGDEALEAMLTQIRQHRTEPSEYHAHLYGGADTMPEGSGLKFNVGERNIEQGWSLIDRHGFQLQGVDVGEDVPRNVALMLATGDVDMRRGIGKAPPTHLPASSRRN